MSGEKTFKGTAEDEVALHTSLVEAILDELERQNPDAVRQDEPGTIWLSGGCTPRSAGCIIDADQIAEAVRDHLARGAA